MKKITTIFVIALFITALAAAGCTAKEIPADNNQITENATTTTSTTSTTKLATVQPKPTLAPTVIPIPTPLPTYAPTPTPISIQETTEIHFQIMQSPFLYMPITQGTTIDAGVQLNTPQHPTFCGRVDFYVDQTWVGNSRSVEGYQPCITNAVVFNTTHFAIGHHTVTAMYAGDTTHTAATVSAPMEIISASHDWSIPSDHPSPEVLAS